MIEALAVFAFICMMYLMYGIGVVHGQRHEERRQKMKQNKINQLGKNIQPSRQSYSWYKNDGYEIFHANLN